MKINEFNESNVREGLGTALLGQTGAAAVKSMFKPGMTTKQQLAQDIFIKDFVADAIASLTNGIQSGLIDPSLSGAPTNGAQQQDPGQLQPEPGQPGASAGAAAPSAPGTAPKPNTAVPGTTAGAVAAKKSQQQTTQNINNYVKNAAAAINQATDKNQKIAITKELVNAMADRQGTPEWDNAMGTVKMALQKGGLDPNFAAAAINNVKSGKTMSEAWRIYFANKLVEAVGLTWRDLGLCVLKEGKNYYIAESKYLKLNAIFESIVEATAGGQSISDYMKKWFKMYMQGVDYDESQAEPLISNVEATYRSDKGRKAIANLAKAAYAMSKGSVPKGAENAVAGPAASGQNAKPAAQAAAGPNYAEEITSLLDEAEQDNPQAYAAMIPTLLNDLRRRQADLKTLGSTGTLAPQPAPAATPQPAATNESRRRR